MLDLGFPETSQNFSSFIQLFFHSFQGEPNEKCWKITKTIHWFLSFFPLVPPWKQRKKLKYHQCIALAIFQNFLLETMKKELKLCEVSESPKSSIRWKFQLSISKTVETSQKWASISQNPVPLFDQLPTWNSNIECYLKLVSQITMYTFSLELLNIQRWAGTMHA